MAIARYTLAVDRRFKQEGENNTDFIGCIAFGRAAEFAEQYLHKGTKIAITGRIQTGSYTNKDGQRVYTTDVVIEEQEFCESKSNGSSTQNSANGSSATYGSRQGTSITDGFINIPDGIDEELPFT